jgi:trk system potassium uptake protein TrkH
MHFSAALRILGLLLMVFSFSLLPPIVVCWIYNDGHIGTFLYSFLITFVAGGFLWLIFYRYNREMRTTDGFLIVSLMWIAISFFGGLPFMLSDYLHASWFDAFYESASGLTTTGATVFVGLDQFPKSILYYRAQLHFFGGLGIIVLAVAVLPMLGVGGMQLLRAEATGPIKDSKFTPRIKETAKNLWKVYAGMTVACLVMLWLGGMPVFDAICYSFSIVATGGFAPHDTSMMLYAQPDLLAIAVFFMLVSSLNFSISYTCVQNLNVKYHLDNAETRWFLFIIICMILFFWFYLSQHTPAEESLSYFWRSTFQVVSQITTTGLTTENWANWPAGLPLLLLLVSAIGGCAGSTAGGLKVIRVLLWGVQGIREIKKLIHPNGRFPLKLDKKVVPERVAEAVWGYLPIYMAVFTCFFVALMFCDMEISSAFSATIAMISNVGPGISTVALDYSEVSPAGKVILTFAMIIGRLEIFTFLAILAPTFWRR